MNINPVIEEIFKDFKVNGKLIPIAFMQYFGNESTYLTYYTWAQKPELFADDNYNAEVCYGTIDIWSKQNFKEILEAVKQRLKQNNFIWTDNAAEIYEPETVFFHVPVNFYVTGEVIFNGDR